MLAERLEVVVESIWHETVRRMLKKNEIKPRQKQQWCIAPKVDAAFVCQMEQVLAIYRRRYDECPATIRNSGGDN